MKKILFQILILVPILSYASDIEQNMSYQIAGITYTEYGIHGNGEKCSVTYDEDNSFTSTTCLSLTNSKGIKILCTKKKKMCKTESEFLNFIHMAKIEKEDEKTFKVNKHASDGIEEISEPWYNAEAPVTDVYIDTLEAFPSDYVNKNSRILCTKLSVKENRIHENLYNIDGLCQLSKDKNKAQSLNPFIIQFLSVRRIAELIMSKKRENKTVLSGVLIKSQNNALFAKYTFVVNSVKDKQ